MTTLPRRTLGRTGLEVSIVCAGCAPLGDMPEAFGYRVPEEQALATLRELFRSPITFLDTAAAYGDGESERRIGLVLRELGGLPPGYVLATKADRDLATGRFDADQVRRSVERSLRLLGLERLQLVYFHDPEHAGLSVAEAMAPGGPVEALLALRDQGVIEHVGIAAGPIDMLIEYVETGVFEVVITHNRYTLLNRTAEPLVRRAHELGVAVVNAAPYGSGLLAKGPSAFPRYAYRAAHAEELERARQLEAICTRYGVPLAAVALQFSLREPRITATIVGMSRPERVAETVRLATWPIPEALWDEVATVAPLPYDPQTGQVLRLE
ncbi:aldo/keto reductase [Thermomicrobium sp. 4228-Ro]|uniref:aldo/keto reductase n=1 Tax=Thermomicrobium sp. 4228-Ro TaxID=2993937 RepID=UPI0022494518|nr:aldo/keto reductase [Thermomicrobium sp. 4228-Ro]MCX2726823.1 aldo/keto reductase [Thermomicrobium sp. 4228-Ro]